MHVLIVEVLQMEAGCLPITTTHEADNQFPEINIVIITSRCFPALRIDKENTLHVCDGRSKLWLVEKRGGRGGSMQ